MVGLKQSNGVIPHSQALDAFGNQTYVTPMTRTVADTALMLQAMAGEDPSDPWSIGVPCRDYIGSRAPRATCAGKRILFCVAARPPGVAGRRGQLQARASTSSAGLGAELSEFAERRPDIEPIWRAINHTVWRARFAKLVAEHGDVLSAAFVQQVALATVSAASTIRRRCSRAPRCSGRAVPACARPLLAMPTLTRTALPIDQDLFGTIEIDGSSSTASGRNWFPWTMPFNMTGHPRSVFPAASARDGLPIGLQLVGRFRADAELLRVSALFEASHDLLSRRPG